MTAIGTIPVLFGTGIHGSRPAASAVGKGGLYACSTHGLIYQTDGSSWSTWATLGTSGAYVSGGTDVAVADGGTGASTASGARTNLGLAIGSDVQAFGAYAPGGTDVAVADGGTGASSASAARTNLGLGTMSVEAKTITTQDDLLVGGSAGALDRLPKGTDGQVLTVDPSTHHLIWATPSSGFANPMTTAGDVIVGGSSGTPGRLAAGATSGHVLTSNGSGVAPSWQAAAGGGGSALTAKDEGSTLDTAVTSIDFVGAGVVATNTGHALTVTVAGGGSGVADKLFLSANFR